MAETLSMKFMHPCLRPRGDNTTVRFGVKWTERAQIGTGLYLIDAGNCFLGTGRITKIRYVDSLYDVSPREIKKLACRLVCGDLYQTLSLVYKDMQVKINSRYAIITFRWW